MNCCTYSLDNESNTSVVEVAEARNKQWFVKSGLSLRVKQRDSLECIRIDCAFSLSQLDNARQGRWSYNSDECVGALVGALAQTVCSRESATVAIIYTLYFLLLQYPNGPVSLAI